MLELPNHILEKLKCAKCGGYLSCGPVVVNAETQQLCGRCFKILPDDVKTLCVRQIGLEAVAECLVFPCRYNAQGCVYTFLYDSGGEHELTCEYRNNSFRSNSTKSLRSNSENSIISSSTISRGHTYQPKELELKVNCANTYDVEGVKKIKLNVEIFGKSNNRLHLSNCDNVKLNVEFVVAVEVEPKITYSHLFVEKLLQQPIYDTVEFIMQSVKCANCQKNIANSEIFHCAFGHSLCKVCKSNTCGICGVLPNSNSQRYCKNYIKGCTDLFPTSDITKHQTDCEFNDYKCPSCGFCDILATMVVHFVEKHEVILSNELVVILSRKDKDWYFYCYDKLFRCRYYNFDDVVEFVVAYIGCHDGACKYKYEVTLTSNNEKKSDEDLGWKEVASMPNNQKKSGTCLGWNETSLGKAISFKLMNNQKKKIEVRVAILSNDLYYKFKNK